MKLSDLQAWFHNERVRWHKVNPNGSYLSWKPKNARKLRVCWKDYQLSIMKAYFQTNQHPDNWDLQKLSEETDVDKKALQVCCTLIEVIEHYSSM